MGRNSDATRHLCSTILAAACLFSVSSAWGVPNLRDVQNLGVAGKINKANSQEPFLLIQIREEDVGEDRNGDGDMDDRVLHIVDLRTLEIRNLGLAPNRSGRPPQLHGRWILMNVRESAQGGIDLNGDGDSDDNVFHIVNRESGEATNLGVTSISFIGKSPRRLAFEVREEGTDLNGDGDTNDTSILFNVDLGVTPVTRNLGASSVTFRVSDDFLAASISERGQGNTDLNGDGDDDDWVIHVYDPVTQELTNLGLDCYCPIVEGPLLSFYVDEGRQSEDLNADGDLDDQVVFVYDHRTEILSNLGLASTCDGSPDILGSEVFFAVDEFDQAFADRNGDGDIFDLVTHSYNADTLQITNLGVAGIPDVTGDLVSIEVNETQQGLTDLNGDGDFLDLILHAWDPETDRLTNIGFPIQGSSIKVNGVGKLLSFTVDESRVGAVDLNGDGEFNNPDDDVVFVYDGNTERVTNTSVVPELDRVLPYGNRIFIDVREGRQGADLNGDGDRMDRVVHLYDASTGLLTNLGLEIRSEMSRSEHTIAYQVNEKDAGEDLDGDGLLTHDVLHVARINEPYGTGSVNSGQGEVVEVLRINELPGTVTVSPRTPFTVSLDSAPLGPTGRYILWGWVGRSANEQELLAGGNSLGHTINPTPFMTEVSPRPFLCLTGADIPPLACSGTTTRKMGPDQTPFVVSSLPGLPAPITMTLQGVIEDAGAGNPLGWSVTNAVTLQVRITEE